VHILESCAEKLDWSHLLRRFGPDWRVLLSNLVLFGYIYPSERRRIPGAVMGQRAHMDAGDIAHWTSPIANENKAEKTPSVK
jgi:hypothetical protein